MFLYFSDFEIHTTAKEDAKGMHRESEVCIRGDYKIFSLIYYYKGIILTGKQYYAWNKLALIRRYCIFGPINAEIIIFARSPGMKGITPTASASLAVIFA